MGGRVADSILRCTKPVVVASWLGAALLELWFASTGRPGRFAFTTASFAVAFIAARFTARLLPALLATMYVAPAVIATLTGAFYVSDYPLWWAPFSGAVLASQRLTSWHLSGRWQAPIALWATSIAFSWPVIVLREVDFNVAYLFGGRPPNSLGFNMYLGGWIASVAGVLLLGFLWFDYLCRVRVDSASFRLNVLWPLAAGALMTFPVAIYQGWVNVSFLSGGIWPSINRAAGTLLDANAFGVVCAFWGVGWFALSRESPGLRSVYLWTIYAASWAAMWATGSRTALLAGVVGAAGILLSRSGGLVTRRQMLAGVAALLVGVGALHLLARSASPLSRISETFSDLSTPGLIAGAQSLWSRADYGTASTAMIRDYPVSGVGIGTFSTLLNVYLSEMERPQQPPDNAQNWYRHQLAETGVLGSLGWIIWMFMLIPAIGDSRRSWRTPLAFALLGFGMTSMLGMPAQNLAVTLTFWTFIAWFAREESSADSEPNKLILGFVLTAVLVGFFAHTAVMARGDLRPPFRAARFGYDYSYGFHVDAPGSRWTDTHAVIVPKSTKPWLKLTYWAEHPDAATNPVSVQIWRNHERIVHRKLWNDVHVTTYVRVPGDGRRFVLETRVDRTFQSSATDGHSVQRGLNVQWEFVDRAPQTF